MENPARRNDYEKTKWEAKEFYKSIIASSTTSVEHRTTAVACDTYRRGKRKITVSHADFWSLTESRVGKTITVVIRQLKGGTKHFFSVFLA